MARRPLTRYPTELELEILKIVWRDGPVTVRQVHEAFNLTRRLAYNTVLTMMRIMTDKGQLSRKLRSNGLFHVYKAKLSQEATSQGMLHDMVTRVYGGSAADTLRALLNMDQINAEELRRIRGLLAGQMGA